MINTIYNYMFIFISYSLYSHQVIFCTVVGLIDDNRRLTELVISLKSYANLEILFLITIFISQVTAFYILSNCLKLQTP